MNREGLRDRLGIIGLLLLYKIVIELSYYFSTSPLYARNGLIWNPDLGKYVYSILLFFILVLTLPENIRQVSSLFCLMFDMISVLPLISFYWMSSAFPKSCNNPARRASCWFNPSSAAIIPAK